MIPQWLTTTTTIRPNSSCTCCASATGGSISAMTLISLEFDPSWRQAVNSRLNLAPLRPRRDLMLNGQKIGSVEGGVVEQLLPDGPELVQAAFSLRYVPAEASWRIAGDGTQALEFLAQGFYAANICHIRQQWRNEQLAVFNETGQQLATAERGITRLLGITTRAVHLFGRTPDGRVWVQQRALDKSNDPGLWDTLMGGMISAADTLQTALQRETWEEAGLHLDQLTAICHGGHFFVQRPSKVDNGTGYVVERIDWFECVVPDAVLPQNQDGEVAQFALLEPAELKSRLEANQFTSEAACIFVRVLGRDLPN